MQKFEKDYAALIKEILESGSDRQTRNGMTRSVFGMNLTIPMNGDRTFPIIQGRKMFSKGILGELAAMLRQPKHIKDFEQWGCNYWKQWANEDGSINVDYGNAWFDFNGFDQIASLRDKLANNPTDRRMIISGWRPDALEDLSLPCCHYAYQFYVRDGKYIDMLWTQRSVDMMIGLPSDIVFAAAWLIAIANEFGYEPGNIKMCLGDCHVYEEHLRNAVRYVDTVNSVDYPAPTYMYWGYDGADFCKFEPKDLEIMGYVHSMKLDLELKS